MIIQHPGTSIGIEPGESAEAAGHQLHRVERPMAQAAERRVGRMPRLSLSAVVQRLSTLKKRIAAFLCVFIEGADRGLQLCLINRALLRQTCQGCVLEQIALANIRRRGERKGLRPAQPITALRTVIADKP